VIYDNAVPGKRRQPPDLPFPRAGAVTKRVPSKLQAANATKDLRCSVANLIAAHQTAQHKPQDEAEHQRDIPTGLFTVPRRAQTVRAKQTRNRFPSIYPKTEACHQT
jgi:hypothetical protein